MKQNFTLQIDGKKTTASEGETILTAAERVGIIIPRLCNLTKFPPDDVCRICVVEVEGAPELVTACTTKAAPDMQIHTANERVLAARTAIVELLVSEGEHDCMVCEVAGKCDLLTIALDLGVEICLLGDKNSGLGFPGIKPKPVIDDSHPLIIWESARCILCNRCVRNCHKGIRSRIQYSSEGGKNPKIESPNANLMKIGCAACGECVQACPTGALMEKNRRSSGPFYDLKHRDILKLKKVDTTCAYCGVGCQVEVTLNQTDGSVAAVEGRTVIPNMGSLCIKGRFAHIFPRNGKRLSHPMIKKNGELTKVTWDEALNFTAENLKKTIRTYGSDSFAMASCAKATNENNYAAMKFTRAVIGTNNIDQCACSGDASIIQGLMDTMGIAGATNSLHEFRDAKAILAIGTNATESHPVVSYYIEEAVKRGCKLIVADVRNSELAKIATEHIKLAPGSDLTFLNGVMRLLLEEGLHDKEFILAKALNWDEMKSSLDQYKTENVAKVIGVSPEQLRRTAKILGEAESLLLCFGRGIAESDHGVETVKSCANLQLMLGNIGKYASGIIPLLGQNNIQGGGDMGALPIFYQNYQKVNDPAIQAKFEAAWNRPGLPTKPGLYFSSMLKGMKEKQIRAFFCFGGNPIVSEPSTRNTIKSLESLDFLAVADIFHTETTSLADVVFPTSSWAETDGTFTNTERRVQRVHPLYTTDIEQKELWWILNELGKRMGFDMGFASAQTAWDDMRRLSAAHGGITWERCEKIGIQWPCPTLDHEGTSILFKNDSPAKKARFAPSKCPTNEKFDSKFPLKLTIRRRHWLFKGDPTHDSVGIDEILKIPLVEINPSDAKKREINNGDFISIRGHTGEIAAKAVISEGTPAGFIWGYFHFENPSANMLTSPPQYNKNDQLKTSCHVDIYKDQEELGRNFNMEKEHFTSWCAYKD